MFFNWCKPGTEGFLVENDQCTKTFPWALINPETLERLAQGAVIPFAIIYVGSKIIPNPSRRIPIFLAVITYVLVWMTYLGMWWMAKNPPGFGYSFAYSGWGWIELVLLVLIQHLSIGITAKTIFDGRTSRRSNSAIA
jgi:uncharacterized membrane protein